MTERYDLLIRGAKIVDGTGNPYYWADVAIANGRIARIQRNMAVDEALAIIEAEGLVLCPGFIDVHTHDELYLLAKPSCDDKILQGVTTVILGNCGQSTAPIADAHETEAGFYLEISGGRYLKSDDLKIRSFADFLRKLEQVQPGLNVASLVGHGAIRIAVMGFEDRPPSPRELEEMKALMTEAMESGACGLSSGLIYTPGRYADVEEIAALARIAGRYHGIYATHLRNEGDMIIPALAEAFEIGRLADLPVHISHHKLAGRHNWGRSIETLEAIETARAGGLTVTCDQYPYQAGSTYLIAALPPSALSMGDRLFSELLKNPRYRSDLVEIMETKSERGWENLVRGAGFDGIVISVTPKFPQYIGRSIGEIAATENRNPYDLIFDLLMSARQNLVVILFMMGEEDIERILRSPLTMIGSDGIPGFGVENVHPRQLGTFPRILGRYVREKRTLTLEEAIRKMTSFSAQTFGLKTKGILREGFDADMVLFDPAMIIDLATYENPNQPPAGISRVFVNGVKAVENGRLTGARSGQILRRGIHDR